MRIEQKYLILAAICLAIIVYIDQLGIIQDLTRQIQLADFLLKFGLVGMFLIALLGSTSILIQIPYTLPMLTVALQGATLEHMLLLGLVAGIGAGCGKSLSYLMADRLLSDNPQFKKHFGWLEKQNPRWLPFIVFVVVATPLPDDTVIIPLATLHYGLKRLILPIQIGKIAHNVTIAGFFYFATEFSAEHLVREFRASMVVIMLMGLLLFICYQFEKARSQLGGNQHIIPQNIALHAIDLN